MVILLKRTITALLLLLSLTSCTAVRAYTADVDAEDVAERMIAALGAQDTFMEADHDLYDYYFGKHAAYRLVDDASMMFSRTETDVSELGVFEAERVADVPAVQDMVKAYLDDRTATLRAFAANYSPEDMQKIDHAGIRVYGRYVVYYILDESGAAAALAAAESMLRAK